MPDSPREVTAESDSQVNRRSPLLTDVELVILGALVEQMHATATDDELEALEAVSRMVNRRLFARGGML